MAIVIRDLESGTDGPSFNASATVECDGRKRPLTLQRYGDHPQLHARVDTFDPLAIALILPAMMRGEPLDIEGTVDEMLLDALRGPIQDTLRLLEPRWRKVPVLATARRSTACHDLTRGAGTAVSGGIDSMHLLRHRLFSDDVPEFLRVRTLVHHHVGAHGDDDAVFAEQFAHVRRIADRLKLPLVGTKCSMTDFYKGTPFIGTVLMRNTAASMAVDHLFAFFHYASSEPIGGTPAVSRFLGIATLEPQLLPLFNTTQVSWLPFGGSTTRLQKTAEVIGDDRLCGDLLVCIRGFRTDRRAVNCGRCFKCARLLLQAEASGRLDAVAASFDMDAFRAGRSYSILRLLRLALGPARNGADIDLVGFLDDRGFRFPAWARPGVALVRLARGGRHSLRGVADGISRSTAGSR